MKTPFSSVGSLTIATIFACLLSCTEQDDVATSRSPEGQLAQSTSLGGNRSIRGRQQTNPFDGSAGDPISLELAKTWTANYRSKNPDQLKGHYFGFEIIQRLLNETNCSGIRIYYGIDETGQQKLLLVGVDADGNDLLPSLEQELDNGGNIVVDYSYPCPDYCPGKEF